MLYRRNNLLVTTVPSVSHVCGMLSPMLHFNFKAMCVLKENEWDTTFIAARNVTIVPSFHAMQIDFMIIFKFLEIRRVVIQTSI